MRSWMSPCVVALVAGAASAQCSSSQALACESGASSVVQVRHEWSSPDIVETAKAAGMFTTLLAAAEAAGLVETLMGEGPFTVFAPTDEAFAKLPAGTVDHLLKPENKAELRRVLLYHVVKAEVRSEVAATLSAAPTASGQRIDIKRDGSTLRIDQAKVIKADIAASNGVIHVIDRVLIPSSKDVVRTAEESGSFGTLLAAVKAAGLAETLMGDGPFTVFAPTDEAFAKLPAGTVESLLKPENREQLRAVLTYHVVPGRVYADELVKLIEAAPDGAAVKTVQGGSVTARLAGGQAMIDGARILTTDIEASNGVIHVIDSVILPQ